jgi:hypothetical protein
MVREAPDYPKAPAPPNQFDTALAQSKALAEINRQEEEPDCERLDAAFAQGRVDPTQRKPPASVNRPASIRALARGRTG